MLSVDSCSCGTSPEDLEGWELLGWDPPSTEGVLDLGGLGAARLGSTFHRGSARLGGLGAARLGSTFHRGSVRLGVAWLGFTRLWLRSMDFGPGWWFGGRLISVPLVGIGHSSIIF